MISYPHHKLVQLWQNSPLDELPFILPGDRAEIPSRTLSIFHSFDEYISSEKFGKRNDTNFHVGLLPLPYLGNLQKPSIFILMLNPGLHPGDYYAEHEVDQFREAYVKNIRQENVNDEYPFFMLDPRFAWHPGFDYWQGKFDDIAQALMKKENITYQNALKKLANNVACLELMPYHSKSFGVGSLLSRLPST